MKENRKRKELQLTEEVIALLEEKARNNGRTLKNYMEFVLLQKAKEIEFEDEVMAIEVRKALAKSRLQSAKGQTKSNQDVIKTARQKVNEYKVDKAG